MNQYHGLARAIKRQLRFSAQLNPDGNPYHEQHIEDFTRYVDASINAFAEDLLKQLPGMIDQRIAQSKVSLDVDEPSMENVRKKLANLFRGLGRWS